MFKFLKCLSFWLVIIGALNWGLIGLFNFNLVAFFLGETSTWTRIVYILVGLCAIIFGALCFMCKNNSEC